jgi:hypothetical protein
MVNIKTSELLPRLPEGNARFWWRDDRINFEDVRLPKSGAYELFTYDQMREYAVAAIESARPPAPKPEQPAQQEPVSHPDDVAINRFAAVMKAKMAKQRAKGYGGWEDKADCPTGQLQQMLIEHIAKGDPVDVANFTMMLWTRGERTKQPVQEQAQETGWQALPAGPIKVLHQCRAALIGPVADGLARRCAVAAIDAELARPAQQDEMLCTPAKSSGPRI